MLRQVLKRACIDLDYSEVIKLIDRGWSSII